MPNQTAIGGRSYQFGLKDRLRVAREMARLSQRDLADITGISRSSIANYEAGITVPRKPQITAWALATGFSSDWLEHGSISNGVDPPSRDHRPGPARKPGPHDALTEAA